MALPYLHRDNKTTSTKKRKVAFNATFLAIIQKCETECKKLIVDYVWKMKPKSELMRKLSEVIRAMDRKLPKDILNRESYVNGMIKSVQKMADDAYDKQRLLFLMMLGLIKRNYPTALEKQGRSGRGAGGGMPTLKSPKDLVEAVSDGKLKLDMWSEAKGSVRVEDYSKKIDEFIKKLAEQQTTTDDGDGKKPISPWQKAELDIRYENQMDMLGKARAKGKYAYTSSHPNSSNRCEKWQGKLFNIDPNAHAELSGFRMREKINGQTIYCLQDVMNQTDKYGYHNNIICGFNCRHYLIPYDGQLPPKEYDEEDVAKQREIEQKIRAMEREIRALKTQYEIMVNEKEKKILKLKIKLKIAKYKAFCEANGYAWEDYRIDV